MTTKLTLDINYTDISEKIYCKSRNRQRHADIFPENIFMILAGSTGSGKTNLMLNFLLNKVLSYDHVMIYTTTSYQPVYKYLRDCNDHWKKTANTATDIVTFHDPSEEMLDPSELDREKTHVIILDDVQNLREQKVMTDYFTRGRHNNVNVFYLCQSLNQLKLHSIRQNANIFILFSQDKYTTKSFYDKHVSSDMKLEEFNNFCDKAWIRKHGYVVINIWESAECGRYLINYTQIYIPEKYLKLL